MSYTFPFTKNVIELGGGDKPYFRPNLDVREGPTVDIVADFNKPLPLTNATYDGVFSCYCIEHLSWRKVRLFLNEVFRILRHNGKAVFVTANTKRQMEHVLAQEEWDDDSSCIIFGGQDYDENTHRNSLCPEYAIKLLREAGFEDVIVLPHGALGTDMIIEATKPNKMKFDRNYFDVGGAGCPRDFYWDYSENCIIYDKVLSHNPKSILELGCARGYLVKRFNDNGIPSKGLEISEHCQLTRSTNDVMKFDITETPFSFCNKEFDLIFSNCFFENIKEENLEKIFVEMARVGCRGLHSIKTHGQEGENGYTFRPIEWWQSKLPQNHVAVDADEFIKGNISIHVPAGDNKLKVNFGSFSNMFYQGWVNTDVLNMQEYATRNKYKFIQIDVAKKLPFPDNSIDLAYSSHMLEHLNTEEGYNFLKECFRCMKSKAVIRISVPDVEKIIKYYQSNQMNMFDELNGNCSKTDFQSGKLWSILFEGCKIAYDFNGLKILGEKAGFVVERKNFGIGHDQILKETIDMFPELSLFVEMIKP